MIAVKNKIPLGNFIGTLYILKGMTLESNEH